MQPIPKDEPIASTSADAQASNDKQIRENSMQTDEEEEYDDNTCCHRATFCIPILREILVTDIIFTFFELQITWADLFWFATVSGLTLLTWAILYFLLGDMVLPGGSIFGLFVLVIFSYALGWSLAYIPRLHLPPIFGMLLAGVIIRNTDVYNIYEVIGPRTTSKIRIFCLTFIMVRAGLQLTTTALRAHPVFVTILSLVPCTIEMLAVTVSCKYLLEFPWNWALMTGSIVACMSPVITISCMLSLAEQGYGEDKGLLSLLCTAASIDDVHIVALFSISFSFVFSNDDGRTEWWSYIPGGIRDFLLGIIVGIILGFALVFFPHRNHKYATWYRIGGLTVASLMCTTAASKLTVTGGGYLATIILSFIAIRGWGILTISYDTTPLHRAFYFLWHYVQPILGGVIGADIDFRNWPRSRFGLYLICIFMGISVRSITAFLTTIRMPFTWKERLFITIAWVPKGTMQAALAPMAYERARKEGDPTKIELALDVVRISVMAIIFLAPLGAIGMMNTGPYFLNKIDIEEQRRERALSYLRIVALQPARKRRKRKKSADDTITTL
ncbi:PREDICTED: sodium/hydrogen exchanger 9B1-like isoform X1 [Trachymyrmex septentrionalis]|uniref:sodium/hydrogen exchanger 9B1-like isoform X1 n=1 Tax=Trachymyrmex septentrionalis TaxID=34720 RepID=UPI00084F604B|nr:PREDICTED: sodium/hydrogen exchanger 9B1-like isoform X1 [Trachymyrmex septentrionalis]